MKDPFRLQTEEQNKVKDLAPRDQEPLSSEIQIKDLFRDWQVLDELKYNLRAGSSRLRADL